MSNQIHKIAFLQDELKLFIHITHSIHFQNPHQNNNSNMWYKSFLKSVEKLLFLQCPCNKRKISMSIEHETLESYYS